MSVLIPSPTALNLKRYPETRDQSLQAWSAADELILSWLKDNTLASHLRILVINDQFGALSVCLNNYQGQYWTDSYLSAQAITKNQKNNLQAPVNFNRLSLTLNKNNEQIPNFSNPPEHPFDIVILRVPKHNSLLKYQLEQIKPLITKETIIVAAGMAKEIHKKNLQIFENSIGPTTTSLAVKKARLIFSQYKNTQPQPWPIKSFNLSDEKLEIYGLPGVFSRDKLDIGAKVLIQHLPELNAGDTAIDLGCGNGVIGAILAQRFPQTPVYLTDESCLAIESARLTFSKNALSNGHFYVTDVLENVPLSSASHVLCNPPFHQQNVQTLSIANKMFKQSALMLCSEGELRVVANRHLPYANMLKNYFKSVSSLSKDSKFTVWLAKNPTRFK